MSTEMFDETAYDSSLAKCRPAIAPAPEKGTFEIGLVLAGAISAGAYTAGVIDFLVEALDAWYAGMAAAREEHPNDPQSADVPIHEVRIRAMSGASAGAITAAIATVALRYKFTHCRAGSPPPSDEQTSGNPLYDAWVTKIDISKLLQTEDLKDSSLPKSLLDSSCLSVLTQEAINYRGASPSGTVGEAVRPYVANPLKLAFTVTNLRGVPYAVTMRGNEAARHEMTAHADWMRFSVAGLNESPAAATGSCPDEISLNFPNSWSIQGWKDLGTAAVASGAFPVGLAARLVTRKTGDFDFRYVIVPGESDQKATLIKIDPTWSTPPGASYSMLCVDGGTMNNEPLDLARKELAGPLGRNPREGMAANRAIIMVDPFPDPPTLGLDREGNLLEAALGLVSAWIEQSRFKPEDTALALSETIYSRFLVSPSRGDGRAVSNGYDIACGGLGGFSGFLHREFRQHDYLLGRRNCQKFLQQHFTLPEGNRLFDGWTARMKERYRVIAPNGTPELPIIPLVGAVNPSVLGGIEEQLPAWPKGAFEAESIRDAVANRTSALFDVLLSEISWFKRTLIKLGMALFGVKDRVSDSIVGKIQDELSKRAL